MARKRQRSIERSVPAWVDEAEQQFERQVHHAAADRAAEDERQKHGDRFAQRVGHHQRADDPAGRGRDLEERVFELIQDRSRRIGHVVSAALTGVTIRRVDFKFRHQKQVEHAMSFIRVDDDYRTPGRRMCDKIRMRHLDGATIGHANCERRKRNLMQYGLKTLGRHIAILPPR
jgi:hypothetical protein